MTNEGVGRHTCLIDGWARSSVARLLHSMLKPAAGASSVGNAASGHPEGRRDCYINAASVGDGSCGVPWHRIGLARFLALLELAARSL